MKKEELMSPLISERKPVVEITKESFAERLSFNENMPAFPMFNPTESLLFAHSLITKTNKLRAKLQSQKQQMRPFQTQHLESDFIGFNRIRVLEASEQLQGNSRNLLGSRGYKSSTKATTQKATHVRSPSGEKFKFLAQRGYVFSRVRPRDVPNAILVQN